MTTDKKESLPDKDIDLVVYYTGYPGLGPMQEGRLKVDEKNLVFKTKDLLKDYFSVPLDRIIDVNAEFDDDFNAYAHLTSELLGYGASDNLFISCLDIDGKEIKLHFVSKKNGCEKLKKMILDNQKLTGDDLVLRRKRLTENFKEKNSTLSSEALTKQWYEKPKAIALGEWTLGVFFISFSGKSIADGELVLSSYKSFAHVRITSSSIMFWVVITFFILTGLYFMIGGIKDWNNKR